MSQADAPPQPLSVPRVRAEYSWLNPLLLRGLSFERVARDRLLNVFLAIELLEGLKSIIEAPFSDN